MYYKIKKVINKWDPINLFPLAPDNEYDQEILMIESYLKNNFNCDKNELGSEINKIFKKCFDDELFTCSLDKCLNVAGEILKQIN